MDRNFYDNEDFEAFLKQKSDPYKMYASDRVWKNVYYSLHGRRRRVVAGLAVLFIASSFFIGRQLIQHGSPSANATVKPAAAASIARTPAIHHLKQYTLAGIMPSAGHRANGNNPAAGIPQNNNSLEAARSMAAAGTAAVAPADITIENTVSVIENGALPAFDGKAQDNPTAVSVPALQQPANPRNNTNAAAPAKKDPATPAALAQQLPAMPAAGNRLKPARWFFQVYSSPIISYRRLVNEGEPGYSAPLSAAYAGNINRYVMHKPAPGFEAGGKIIYRLSNSLSLYGGLQFNYSRYYIDAYKYRVEKASIALNDIHSHDTLSGYTDIRNFSGYSPEQLQNQYWQLSVPVGVEIKLLGNKKLQFNVAGGIQPTLLVKSNSYLITSDYKNYIQTPDLARTLNVHANFEAFLSYQAAGLKWQLGPQFRSQLLSSYSNQYRVREYLTEFGIKFGITKAIK